MRNVVDLWHVGLAGTDRAERSTRARGALRIVLARYLGTEPAQIAFDHGANGKPCLPSPDGAERAPLGFNLSHSGDRCVIAIARGRRVGVDVQEIRADALVDEVASRFYSRGEAQRLSGLGAAERTECFFRWWTRKEALVKARGGRLLDGLATPLLDESTPFGIWSRCDLDLTRGWVGALVVEGGPFEVRDHWLRPRV